jgi:hypothetical protein
MIYTQFIKMGTVAPVILERVARRREVRRDDKTHAKWRDSRQRGFWLYGPLSETTHILQGDVKCTSYPHTKMSATQLHPSPKCLILYLFKRPYLNGDVARIWTGCKFRALLIQKHVLCPLKQNQKLLNETKLKVSGMIKRNSCSGTRINASSWKRKSIMKWSSGDKSLNISWQ